MFKGEFVLSFEPFESLDPGLNEWIEAVYAQPPPNYKAEGFFRGFISFHFIVKTYGGRSGPTMLATWCGHGLQCRYAGRTPTACYNYEGWKRLCEYVF
jgi:hypothetical protein